MNPDRPPFFKTALATALLSTAASVVSLGVLARHSSAGSHLLGDTRIAYEGNWPSTPRTLPFASLTKTRHQPDIKNVQRILGMQNSTWKNDEAHQDDKVLRLIQQPLPALVLTTTSSTPTISPRATQQPSTAATTSSDETPPTVPEADPDDAGDSPTRAKDLLQDLLAASGVDTKQWAVQEKTDPNSADETATAWPRIDDIPAVADLTSATVHLHNGTLTAAYLPLLALGGTGHRDVIPAQHAFENLRKHRASTQVITGNYTHGTLAWNVLANDGGEPVLQPTWEFTQADGRNVVVPALTSQPAWPVL